MCPPASVTATAPVWFLDVDGVIAPLGNPAPGPEYATLRAGGWVGTVPYRPDLLARISELHRSGLVEVRWLTTWEDEANRIWVPLTGFGPFRTHTTDDAPAPEIEAGWWKAQVVHAFLETTDRDVVWTDDEIDERYDPAGLGYDDASANPAAVHPGRVHTVSPATAVGLTAAHLDGIAAFLHARSTTQRTASAR